MDAFSASLMADVYKRQGHGLAVGAQEGLGGVDQRVDGGAGEGLVGQGQIGRAHV